MLVLRNEEVVFKEVPDYFTDEKICEMYNENTRIRYYDGNNKEQFDFVKKVYL